MLVVGSAVLLGFCVLDVVFLWCGCGISRGADGQGTMSFWTAYRVERPTMRAIAGDLRYALRQLKRAPTFVVVTVLTLALGVGLNTALFGVIEAVLLHPAGVTDPASVASFHTRYTKLNLPSIGVSVPDFGDAQSLKSIVESAAMSEDGSFNSIVNGRTQHLLAGKVTWQWFQVFGARPILGRTFVAEEDQKAANHVVVLSYAAWQQLFGGQHDAIGKTLLLDGQGYQVIGVMRSDFDWPRRKSLWVPLGLEPDAYNAHNRFNENYDSVVRLKPGVQVSQFNAALEQKRLEEIRREGSHSFGESAGWSLFAQPLTQDAGGDLRKPLLALFAVVAMILLIACANISGLMLARASGRMREMAIRTALGASVAQLTRQLVVETVLLAGIATVLGAVSGPLLGKVLLSAIPHDLAAGFSVHTNPRLVLAAAGFGLLAAFLAGVAPVWTIARKHRSLRLAEYGKSATAGAARQRLRGVLVSSEVALAFLLVAGTGMFLSSLRQLQDVDPGFRSEGVLTGHVTLSAASYRDNDAKKANFIESVTARMSQQPGVVASAAVYPLPFGNMGNPSGSFSIEERPSAPNDPGPHSDKRWATPGYLSAIQIPLLRGRWFTEGDRANTQPVAVIDDVLAQAYWPDRDPIGQHVRQGSKSPWIEIVGVVGHVRRDSLEVDENKGVMYEAFAQNPVDEAAFVVRTKIDAEAMQGPLTEAVREVDPSEAIYDVRTLTGLVSESLATRQLMVWLLTLFGGVALLLATIGIYGLLSFTASQRTAEIGVRMALGARRGQIVGMMLREFLWLVGIGLVVGLGFALAAQRVLAHAFAAMQGGILSSIAVAAMSLLVAGVVAALVPARRAANVDPVIALRAE
jgi:predicted permease